MLRMKCRSSTWLLSLLLVSPHSIRADSSVPIGYRSVAAEQGIPEAILYAMALTESGKTIDAIADTRPWPWTLNVAGQGYFFDSRLAAWQALRSWLQTGESSIDIGLMQVNWHYHQDKLGSPWQALEPYHNLRVGAAILQTCYQVRQEWWSSVGCYHAPSNQDRADRYRQRVVAHWRRLSPGVEG